MKGEWVKTMVLEWIAAVADVETLRDWNAALCDRIKRLDASSTSTERVAYEVAHSPSKWRPVDLEHERENGFNKMGLKVIKHRVRVTYERLEAAPPTEDTERRWV